MKVRIVTATTLVYVSFAFDSLLKIGVGFQAHLGLLAAIFLAVAISIQHPKLVFRAQAGISSFLIFVFYCFFVGVYFSQPGFIIIFTYLFLGFVVLFYCNFSYFFLRHRAVYFFQVFMLLTGFIQYGVYKTTGYQIAFIDSSHYEKGYSVTHRLRGFFLEPNWYAVAFAFNTLLLAGNDIVGFFRRYPVLAGLSFLAFVLNGSMAPVGMMFIIYFYPIFRRNVFKGMVAGLIMLVLLVGVLLYRGSLSGGDGYSVYFNYASRLLPFLRTIEYLLDSGWQTLVFGNGLGSWGTLAIENRLSVLVYEKDPAVRDGSEVPVLLFELGLLGCLLLTVELVRTFFAAKKSDIHVRGAVILFAVCLVFYPTLKFWMYMPYYFYLRRQAYGK